MCIRDRLRGVLRGKLQLDAGVETVLTDVRIRELRTLIPTEALRSQVGITVLLLNNERESTECVLSFMR